MKTSQTLRRWRSILPFGREGTCAPQRPFLDEALKNPNQKLYMLFSERREQHNFEIGFAACNGGMIRQVIDGLTHEALRQSNRVASALARAKQGHEERPAGHFRSPAADKCSRRTDHGPSGLDKKII